MYQSYREFIEASDQASARLAKHKSTLEKKLEAKRVELQQTQSALDYMHKANAHLEKEKEVILGRCEAV